MSALLPLSPALTSNLETAADVQRALYQMATLASFEDVHPALAGIESVIRPIAGEELSRVDGLLGDDPSATAQALAEIAGSAKRSPRYLTALAGSPSLRYQLGATAEPIRVGTSSFQAGLQSWISSMPRTEAPSRGFSWDQVWGLWGRLNYWTGLPMACGGAVTATVLAGIEAVNAFAGAPVDPERIAAAAALYGGATYLGWQRQHASNALTDHARKGTIEHEHIREFLDRYRGPFPFQTVDVKTLSPNRDILDDIRRSAGPGGPQTISHATTARLSHDFWTFGNVAARSFREDPSQVLYDRLAQAIGMGALEQLRWQPIILHPERLQELRDRQQRGRKLIFVANHRSHLDILSAVALFRDFRVRFPAKEDLFKIPVLKNLLSGANHPRINRADKGGRYKALLRQGVPLLEKGLSLYIFSEGTRTPTPDRHEEVGLLPFELGAFGLALQFAGGDDVVPISNYGLGRTLPGDDRQAAREGTMINPPVVISIGEPIEIERFIQGRHRDVLGLGNLAWSRVWEELKAIQAYMNHGTDI